MKTVLSFCSMVWLAANVAQAQFVLDCACLAQQPGLHVTNCTATIPDLCAIVTNCFRGTVVPPPQIPPFQCSQTPTAGTIVGPGVYGITVTVQIAGVPPLQCLVPFQVVGPNAGQFTLQCAPNKTVNCSAQWGFDPPTPANPCCPNAAQPNGGVVISVVSTVTNGTCPKVITRTWQGVDNCGQTATCSQTVTVVDTVPPTITCGPNQTVNCGQQWNFSTPTISDNCTASSDLVLSIVSTTSAGTCPQVITRIWQVTDLCGNKTLCTETVTIQDLIPPTITCAPNKTVPCGTQWAFNPPSATDNCSSAAGTPSVTIAVVSTVTNSFCPLVVTRTWSATDACGNSSQCSQTVTVGGPGGLTLNCAILAMLPELQTNACDGFVPALCPRALVLAQQNCLCPLTCVQSPAPGTQYGPGTYPITITVSDGAGGTATCTVNFVVTAPPGGCNTNCVPPPPNMVAWWPLDELNGATVFSDFSGNGNTAIVESGGPLGSPLSPTAAPGMVAGSSYFIDNSTRGRAPNSGTLNFSSSSFSMDCWFWPVDQGPFNRWQPMIDKFHPGTLLGYMIGITNYISGPNNFGRVAITVGDGAASTYYSVATVNFSAWNFVGIIVDRTANTVRFNINGVLEPPIPLTLGGSINNSLDLLIGATQVGLNVTEMRLDEIELFDRALNPSELADIWAANALGKCKTNCVPQTRVWNSGASGGTLLAPGTPDPNYVLVSAPPGGCTGPAQVLGGGLPGVWVPNGPNSQWIGAGPTVNCQEGVYHYRTCFYLPCTDGASVIGQWAADDNAAMLLNGQPTGNTIPSIQFPNLPGYGWFPVAITNGFVCGFNCLDFYVTNANIGINPTGFRAELTNVFNDCCVCSNIVNCTCDFVNGDFSTFVPVNGTGGGWTSYDLFAGAGWQGAGGNPGGTFLLNNVGDPSTDPTIAQQLCCLTPGQCYTIRGQRKVQAWFQQTQPSFAVLVDGAPILVLPVPSNPANANWYPFTASFTATNKCQTIAFAAEYGGSDVSYWIDNITLECCQTNPCPVSVICPPNISRNICGLRDSVTYPLPVASSSCGLAIVSVICNPPSGSLFNIGVTTVNCVATDAQGNTASCSFTVTLAPDVTPPVIDCTCLQAAIPPRVNACSYTVPDLCQFQNCFSDNCTPPGQFTCTQSPPAGTVLPAGASYIITLTVTDGAGNVSAPCSVGISVIAPTDTRVWNTGGSGSQAANFTVIQTPGGPANIPAVPTQIATGAWLPNDANSSWVSFTPNSQNAAPGVYIYRLIFNIPCTNGASIVGRFMSDDAARIWLNGVPTAALSTSFSTWTPVSLTSGFVPGVNTLDIHVTNAVIWTGIRTELTNAFNCCCPQAIALNCPRTPVRGWTCSPNGVVNVPFNVTASSLCPSPGVTVSVVCVPPSPGPFPVGTTTVNCTATDSLGNTTSCSFPVTVVRDIIPPVITCPGPITRVICANSVPVYYKATAKDDCSPTVSVTCVPPSGTVFTVGSTIVTCTATDACGNSSSCSFPVTVINNSFWQLFPSGVNDCYAQSGFEPNSPGACLNTAYPGSNWKNYDITTVNRWVGHTWTFPPSWNILGAQLATRARPPVNGCSGISDNDSIQLGLINCTTPSWLWSRYLGSGNASPGLVNKQWCSGDGCQYLFNYDLATLPLTPSGTISLLPHMNSADRLDLFFQDDTTVDFANLRILRCPPSHVIGGIGTEILNARLVYGPISWCLVPVDPVNPHFQAIFRVGEADGLRLPIEPIALSDHPGSAIALGEVENGAPVDRLRAALQTDGGAVVSLGELPAGVTHIDIEVESNGEVIQSFPNLPATSGQELVSFPGTDPVVELATANGNEVLLSILGQEPDQPAVKQTLRVRYLAPSKRSEAELSLNAIGLPEIGIQPPELQYTAKGSTNKPVKVTIRGGGFGNNPNNLCLVIEVSGGQVVASPFDTAGNLREGFIANFPPTDEFRAVVPSPFGTFAPVPTNAELRSIVRGIIDQDDDGDGVNTLVEGDVDVARFVAPSDGTFGFDFTWSSARVHPVNKIYKIVGPAGTARLVVPGNSNVVINVAELPVMHGKLGGRTPCRRFTWPKPTTMRIAGQTYEGTELQVLVETDNYPVTALTGLRLEAVGAESLMLSGLGVGPEEYRLETPELTPDGLFLRWSGFGGVLEETMNLLGPWAPTPGQFEQTQGEVLTPHDPATRAKFFRVHGE